MRIDYCDYPDCPHETNSTYSVKELKTGVRLFLCTKHFKEFQVEAEE